jgi:hypothetical protein
VSGGWISDFQLCYPYFTESLKGIGYVARLAVDGSLDSSFGGDGVVFPDLAKEVAVSPLLDSGGVLSIGADPRCGRGGPEGLELTRVGEDGEVDGSFGSAGLVSLPFWFRPGMARDRFGRILLLAPAIEDESWLLQRLSPHGAPDRRLESSGSASIAQSDHAAGPALAVNHRGQPIIAATIGGPDEGEFFLLQPRIGSKDRHFGFREVSTRFPGSAQAQQILVGGNGKTLVGGTLLAGDRYGIALARYLSR